MAEVKMAGGCHCGAVQFNMPCAPDPVLQCNCSLCRKTGWIGGFWHPDQVDIIAKPGAQIGYVQGDKTITVWHCRTCGCTTHWTPLTAPPDRMGVNMRMFASADWAEVEIIHVDGASL